jgi:hypothetical protein
MMLKLYTETDITPATKGLAAWTVVQIEFMKVPLLPEILAAEPSKSVWWYWKVIHIRRSCP